MENGDRSGEREDEAAARNAFETARREIEAVSDGNGMASLSDLYRVLDKLNDEIKFGGKTPIELALATDVAEDWYAHLSRGNKATRQWPLFVAVGACALTINVLGRSNFILAGCAIAILTAAAWVGNRFGWNAGYETGIGKGYSAAVLHQHGIRAAEERAFWDAYHTAEKDRNLVEFLAKKGL